MRERLKPMSWPVIGNLFAAQSMLGVIGFGSALALHISPLGAPNTQSQAELLFQGAAAVLPLAAILGFSELVGFCSGL